jgi:hypothetical protein
MLWWIKPDHSPRFGDLRHTDPGGALTSWRTVKILRGLTRHSDHEVRLTACETLLHMKNAQDDCWDQVQVQDRKYLNRHHNLIPPEEAFNRNRRFEQNAENRWRQKLAGFHRSHAQYATMALDELRLMTALRDNALRRRFCSLYQQTFPDDTDNGCPADQPRPATIVTRNGDVPLAGGWPD